MSVRGIRLAAAALAAAAFARAAAAGAPAPPDGELDAAERRLAAVEALGRTAEDGPLARAERKLEAGETRSLREDWTHAAVLLSAAVDEPAFRESPRRPEGLFLLAEALRRQGACGAARPRYAELLALGASARRGDAIAGALDCAVRERRSGDVEALLAEAGKAFGEGAPPEVRYLAAKALFQRTDLAPRERARRAAAAFDLVGGPFLLQARYFQGVLALQQGNLHGSLQWFEACARSEPPSPAPPEAPRSRPVGGAEDAGAARDAEVRELCILALGRVHSDMGNAALARDWYAAVPPDSPRFPEALYELAWALVKDRRYEQALRAASFAADLAPGSALAPEATVLRGHLLLRLGRYSEATDAYDQVINAYAPVRDELDAVLAMREDLVRSFDDLVGREGTALDLSAVLPAVAVRWASSQPDVAVALDLVRSLDRARRELQASRDVAARIEALLAQGGELDAFPALRRGHACAEAVENDAALLEGRAVAAQSAAAERALPPERRQDLALARAARLRAGERMRTLPRTPEEVDARLGRMRARLDQLDRSAHQLGHLVESLAAGVGGIERWAEEHRSEIEADRDGRQRLAEELRRQREVVAGYEEALRAVRLDAARARDAAGGVLAAPAEARVREEYLAAVRAERAAGELARGALAAGGREAFDRADALQERLGALRARAEAARLGFAAEATRRAGELRGRLREEQAALATQAAALDGVQGEAKELVRRIARRAVGQAREQFYRLVLKADVGIVDVAWNRKRERLDRIQQLSQQKAGELELLDREYRALGREVDDR